MSVIEKEVLLKAVAEPVFGKDIFSQLPSGAFDSREEYKELYMIIKQHYRTNTSPIGERTLLNLVEDKLTRKRASDEKLDSHLEVVHDLYELEDKHEDRGVIDQQIQKYVKKTLSASLIRETLSKKSLDDEGVIEDLSEQLKQIAVLNSTSKGEQLVDFFGDTELKKSLYTDMKENRFSTGFQTIDGISGGGLARGEMGLVIAKSGGGKSSWAVQQTTNYVKRGMNVLYIILEEKLDRMLFKVEQNFLGINKGQMFDETGELKENVFDAAQELYKQQPNLGKLFFDKHNPQEVTLAILEQTIINASIRKDVQIDAVIIDYPDLMKNTYIAGGLSESDAGGKLYEGIRGLAQKYNYVCWVLSQLNRTGYGQDIKTAENIEGSKRKLNAVEMAFTINQTDEEFREGYIRVHIDKMRYSSETPYDSIQHFKVERNGLIIRDETPEELTYHKQLLNKGENFDRDSGSAYDKANHTVSNLNSKL